MKGICQRELEERRLYHGFFEDFHWLRDELWTETEADAGATTAIDADGVGGQFLITVDTNDNDEGYIESPEQFLFAANKPLVAEARIKYAETNTDDANVIFGVANAPGANYLQDDGAGPPASYYGAVIFKVDGGTTWMGELSNAATQSTGTSTTTAGGTSWQTLRIEWVPITSTRGEATFLCDPNGGSSFQVLRDSNLQPLKYELAFTSTPGTTDLAVFVGAKTGAAQAENIYIDYVACFQKR